MYFGKAIFEKHSYYFGEDFAYSAAPNQADQVFLKKDDTNWKKNPTVYISYIGNSENLGVLW